MNRYLIAGLAVVACTACSPKDKQITQAVTPPPTHAAPVKKTLKPGAPVSLIDAQPVTININQSTPLTLRLQTPPQGRLVVNISAGDGLQLVDTVASQVLELNSAEVSLPVHLMATGNGRFHLNIEATLETAEARSSRNMTLVVQAVDTSGKSLKSSIQTLDADTEQGKTSTNEAVISLPAKETIQVR